MQDSRHRRGGRFRDHHRRSRAQDRGWRKQKVGGRRDEEEHSRDLGSRSASSFDGPPPPPYSDNSSNGYWPHHSRVAPPPPDLTSGGNSELGLPPPGPRSLPPPPLHVPQPPPHLVPLPSIGVLATTTLPPPVPVLNIPPPTLVTGGGAAFTAVSTSTPPAPSGEDISDEGSDHGGSDRPLDLDTRLQMLMKARSANMPAFLLRSDSSDDDDEQKAAAEKPAPPPVTEGPLSRAPSPFMSREAYLASYRLTSQQEELERVNLALASMPPISNGLFMSGLGLFSFCGYKQCLCLAVFLKYTNSYRYQPYSDYQRTCEWYIFNNFPMKFVLFFLVPFPTAPRVFFGVAAALISVGSDIPLADTCLRYIVEAQNSKDAQLQFNSALHRELRIINQ
jgi:hypothetical protein